MLIVSNDFVDPKAAREATRGERPAGGAGVNSGHSHLLRARQYCHPCRAHRCGARCVAWEIIFVDDNSPDGTDQRGWKLYSFHAYRNLAWAPRVGREQGQLV